MEKHLLVTVDENVENLDGVRFVADFFSASEDLNLTFFYTVSNPAQMTPGDTGARTQAMSCGTGPQNKQIYGSLERARLLMCGRGFGRGGMRAKTVFKRYTSIMDIMLESEKGLYDAVVLGPRGLSLLEQAFGTGLSRGVLEKYAGAPLWLCRDVEDGREGVLLCVDGSVSSLAMADHVGFMLRFEPRHSVTLFTVTADDGRDGGEAEAALGASMAALLENGLDEERIAARIEKQRDVAGAILREAEGGRYAAVAMGRTGVGQGRFPRLFMGSASDTLCRELRGAALWVCR